MTDKEIEEFGYHFGCGFLRKFFSVVLAWLIVYVFFSFLANPTDDSDTSFFNRSGLKIHIDAKTGIEYLSDGHGGLIRRG